MMNYYSKGHCLDYILVSHQATPLSPMVLFDPTLSDHAMVVTTLVVRAPYRKRQRQYCQKRAPFRRSAMRAAFHGLHKGGQSHSVEKHRHATVALRDRLHCCDNLRDCHLALIDHAAEQFGYVSNRCSWPVTPYRYPKELWAAIKRRRQAHRRFSRAVDPTLRPQLKRILQQADHC